MSLIELWVAIMGNDLKEQIFLKTQKTTLILITFDLIGKHHLRTELYNEASTWNTVNNERSISNYAVIISLVNSSIATAI